MQLLFCMCSVSENVVATVGPSTPPTGHNRQRRCFLIGYREAGFCAGSFDLRGWPSLDETDASWDFIHKHTQSVIADVKVY